VEYTIIYNSSLAIGILAIVAGTAIPTYFITHFVTKIQRRRHILANMEQHVKDELARKDRVIRDKNATISAITEKYQIERSRNVAAMLTAQRLERILASDDPNGV
jgi:hypothetical protein